MPRLLHLFLLFLLSTALVGCPVRSRGDDDDDATGDDDDDATGDDDDATGDDDDATGDDDDATGDDDDATADDDDATGDDDDDGGDCQIALSFDTGDTTACQSPWMEGSVEMQFRNGSCGSICSGEATSSGVWVYPAELYVDFSGAQCVPNLVEVEINDYTGIGAVDAVLYDGSGNVIASTTNATVGSPERLTLTPISGTPVAFGISGCETAVLGAFID